MAAVDTDWEEWPSYFDTVRSIRDCVAKTYREVFIEKKEISSDESLWRYYNISVKDILLVILLSVLYTILRHLATKTLFRPLVSYYALTSSNQKKMPESAWKFTYFLCAWSYTFYLIVWSGNYKFFQRPSTVWDYWSLDKSAAVDIYFLYMAQCGFYIHASFATMFMDSWKKDSLVFMLHHVLTLLMISISYSLRYHNIGTLLFLTHDLSECFLEFSKLNIFFRIQEGKLNKWIDIVSNISFLCFVISWCVGRLYCFPLRVLYTAATSMLLLDLPVSFLLNIFLWILQILNIYWSLLIVQVIVRIISGHKFDDIREIEEEKSKRSSKKE